MNVSYFRIFELLHPMLENFDIISIKQCRIVRANHFQIFITYILN
jgi:hypothetical protein